MNLKCTVTNRAAARSASPTPHTKRTKLTTILVVCISIHVALAFLLVARFGCVRPNELLAPAPPTYVVEETTPSEAFDCLPVYWINRQKDSARRATMESMFRGLAGSGYRICPHRVQAVERNDVKQLIANNSFIMNGFSLGELQSDNYADAWEMHSKGVYLYTEAACTLSHLGAVLDAHEKGYEEALIIEDDINITETFMDMWREYAALAPDDWNCLQWTTSNKAHVVRGSKMLDPWITWHSDHWSAGAYMVNKRGTKEILSKTFSRRVDHSPLWRIAEPGLLVADEVVFLLSGNTYTSTYPWWVTTNQKVSTIRAYGSDDTGRIALPGSLEGFFPPSIDRFTRGLQSHRNLGSTLVVTSFRATTKLEVEEEVKRIRTDYKSMLPHQHSQLTWFVCGVVTDDELAPIAERSGMDLPSNVSLIVDVKRERFNKFQCVYKAGKQLGGFRSFDRVLLKDSDMRLAGFPWRTFVRSTKNTLVASALHEAPLSFSRRMQEGDDWYQFHEATGWKLNWYNEENFVSVAALPVTFLEQAFVLIDGSFADWFLPHILNETYIAQPYDWGPDKMWCKAAEDFNPNMTSCALSTAVVLHEDTNTLGTFNASDDQMRHNLHNSLKLVHRRWMTAVDRWDRIIGGRSLSEVERECKLLTGEQEFSLTACTECAVKLSRQDDISSTSCRDSLVSAELMKSYNLLPKKDAVKIPQPRVMVSTACSGSYFVMKFAKRLLLSHSGYTSVNPFPYFGDSFFITPKLRQNPWYNYTLALKDPFRAGAEMVLRIQHDLVAKPLRERKAHSTRTDTGSSSTREGPIMLANLFEDQLTAGVAAGLRALDASVVVIHRSNLLDRAVCETKRCFPHARGVTVFVNGTEVDDCSGSATIEGEPTLVKLDVQSWEEYARDLVRFFGCDGAITDKRTDEVVASQLRTKQSRMGVTNIEYESLAAFRHAGLGTEKFAESVEAWRTLLQAWDIEPNATLILEEMKTEALGKRSRTDTMGRLYNGEEAKQLLHAWSKSATADSGAGTCDWAWMMQNSAPVPDMVGVIEAADKVSPEKSFCETGDALQETSSRNNRRNLILTFSIGRTGSTLLGDVILRDIFSSNPSDFVYASEAFGTSEMQPLRGLLKQLPNICSISTSMVTDIDKALVNCDGKATEELESILIGNPATKSLLNAMRARFIDPLHLLRYLRDVPGNNPRTFSNFKVFPCHLRNKLNMSVESFMEKIFSVWSNPRDDVKVIVLWRSRVIESFVSQEIAAGSKTWQLRRTSANDTVTIDKPKIKAYLDSWFEYYRDVWSMLNRHNVSYQVVEYNRDLLDPIKQANTQKRLARFFEVSPPPAKNEGVQQANHIVKQAQVPVDRQVSNWQDIQKWGFDFDDPDFNHFFGSSLPPWKPQQ